ncbi:MAG TPA: ATP-binding protein [Rhodanobacter sp.]
MKVRNAWVGISRWLGDTPVADPVDRRNAPFMQVLLICMGTLLPINKVIHLCNQSFRRSMTPSGLLMDVATELLMMAAAWTSLYWIRQGRFREAVKLYLGIMLLLAALAYGAIGLIRLGSDPFPLLLLGLSGLMLGRRELWTTYGLLLLVFAVGTLSDMIRQMPQGNISWDLNHKYSMAVSYMVVAVVLDRTIAALRESLDESNLRGLELQRTNRRLEQEMAERERAQGRLIHAQKMEVAGRIASGVAHDFDNVMNVVLGYAARRERLADQGTQALLGALEGVELAAHRALAISRKLLNFSRQDTPRLEVFDAAQALRDIQPMLRQLFDSDVRIELGMVSEALPIRMDRTQFELMLLNLASNARDAMPEGGIFSVTAATDGNELKLVLKDNGDGMPEDVRRRIFEAFFTTKPIGFGTGLGLAVVNDLIAAHDGSIIVESASGVGTTFQIRLPLAMEHADT